jgi:hypothetical protein
MSCFDSVAHDRLVCAHTRLCVSLCFSSRGLRVLSAALNEAVNTLIFRGGLRLSVLPIHDRCTPAAGHYGWIRRIPVPSAQRSEVRLNPSSIAHRWLRLSAKPVRRSVLVLLVCGLLSRLIGAPSCLPYFSLTREAWKVHERCASKALIWDPQKARHQHRLRLSALACVVGIALNSSSVCRAFLRCVLLCAV